MTRERLLRSAFLLVVLLIALFLRVWQLETLPPGLYHDEAYNGLDALSLAQGKTFPQFYEGWELYAEDAHGDQPVQDSRWPLFFEGNYGREPLHIYLMAISIKLFDANAFAIRLVPALAGVVGVLTTYLAAKQLVTWEPERRRGKKEPFRWRQVILDPALIAALAMATIFPAVHFSRFGVRAMLFVPLATLTVYFFWRGINSRHDPGERRRMRLPAAANFPIAGFFLGFGLYSYAAARLFPLVFVIFVAYWFWRDQDALRRHWRHIVAMAGLAFLTTLPLLLFFARYPYYFVFRIAYVANRGKGAVEGRPWLTWLMNVGRVVNGLFVAGETHLRHNLPGRPFLDLIQAGLFVAGAIAGIRQRFRLPVAFLWIWLLVMLLPSIFSGDAPHFGRLVGAAPVLAVFIGLGWTGLVRFLSERYSESRSGLIFVVFGLLLLASLLWTAIDYFVRYASHPELPGAFYQSDWELGEYLASYPAATALYLTPSQEELVTIYFALGSAERLTNFTAQAGDLPSDNLSAGIVPGGFSGQAKVYVIRPPDSAYLDRVRGFYPDGDVDEEQNSFLSYYVASELPMVALDNEVGFLWSDQIELAGWSREWQDGNLTVTLAWKAGDDLDGEYTAFVHLLDEKGAIIAQVDRQPAGYSTGNWRQGETVIDTFILSLPPGYSGQELLLQTGFYDSFTLTNLGPPVVLDQFVAGAGDQ